MNPAATYILDARTSGSSDIWQADQGRQVVGYIRHRDGARDCKCGRRADPRSATGTVSSPLKVPRAK